MVRFLLTVAAVCAFSASAAGAAPARVFLSVTPTAVDRGHTVLIRGNAASCRDNVTIISHAFAQTHEFAGVPAVFARVRSGGAFRTTTRIPATKRPGLYAITARCGGGNLGVVAHLRVLR
jgi:hypothetical protein